MYEVRFFKADKFDYEIGEEKWIAAIQTDLVPRIGDNVAVFPDEDSLEVINVELYYEVAEENRYYKPLAEVLLLAKDAE